jgi:hypothetical protein
MWNFIYEVFDIWNLYVDLKQFHIWKFHIWNIWCMKSLCGIETISCMKISYMKNFIYEIFIWNWNNFIYENFIYENFIYEIFHVWNISYMKFVSIPYNDFIYEIFIYEMFNPHSTINNFQLYQLLVPLDFTVLLIPKIRPAVISHLPNPTGKFLGYNSCRRPSFLEYRTLWNFAMPLVPLYS